MSQQKFSIVLAWLTIGLSAGGARADFVELERLFDPSAGALATTIDGRSVVVAVRNRGTAAAAWDVAQASGVELTEALRCRKIDAVRAAADARLIDLESVTRSFTRRDAQVLRRIGRQVLVGVEFFNARQAVVKIAVFSANSPQALWTTTIALPDAAQSLAANIPPMNRAVVEFARQNLGRVVREGDCTQLAEDGLKAAGTGKRGVYRWGRELDEGEPWLPGDILQMERVEVKTPGFERSFGHHTAVVEEADAEKVVVLHQNAFPDGNNMQRESWPRAGISGLAVAYRPWDWPAESPLPPASPSRASPPLVVRGAKNAKRADLLALIDPDLDRVQGLCSLSGAICGLRANSRRECRFP